MIVALIGGGNGAHVLAGLLGGDHEVRVHTSKADKWRSSVAVNLSHNNQTRVGKVRATDDMKTAVEGADVVILCLPVYLYVSRLQQMARYLKDDVIIGNLFAQDYFPHTVRRAGINTDHVTLFATPQIPWICRTEKYGELVSAGRKLLCPLVVDGPKRQAALDFVQSTFETTFDIHPNFLTCVFVADNSILHPAILNWHMGDWDNDRNFTRVPYFYRDLGKDGIKSILDVDAESLELSHELDKRYPFLKLTDVKISFPERTIASYETELKFPETDDDVEIICTFFREHSIMRNIKFPMKAVGTEEWIPDVTNRMFFDDIAHGLCNFHLIGEWLGVETPACDRLIMWAQRLIGKEYLVDGRLVGKNSDECDLYGTTLKLIVQESAPSGTCIM